TAADRGRVISASGSWVLTLPLAAHAGAAFFVSVVNTGTGTITLTRQGSDSIDGAATLALPRGHGVLVISTGSGWLTLGRPVTAGPTDAMAGRVLQVGDGGLLATAPVTVSLNAMMPAGTYTYVFSDPAIPSSGSGAVIVLRSAATVNFQAQIASPLTGGVFLRRTQDAGVTWTPWERIVTLRGLLGTVSQSGGVPTGAVLERGSNANGDYLRLADGTQICWITAGLAQSIPAGAYVEASWTYPAVFVSGSVPQPRVAVRSFNDPASRQSAARHLRGVGGGVGATAGVLGVVNLHSAAVEARLDGLALGRWF
ncbi:pyocin knob domain-containing protein, partial [Gemmobacter denitrificans]